MTFTVKDIENRYSVSEHTVLHWITTGQLVAVNVGKDPGKLKPRYRITQQSVDAFELSRSTSPPPTPSPRKRRKASTATNDVVFYK